MFGLEYSKPGELTEAEVTALKIGKKYLGFRFRIGLNEGVKESDMGHTDLCLGFGFDCGLSFLGCSLKDRGE